LNLGGDSMCDDRLNRALCDAPSNSIILLEDVDGIFVEREAVDKHNYHRRRRVTFAGLLNALDGIRSQEGRIIFMTTNHREKLDPALLRPGRSDMQVKLDNASAHQMENLFLKFHPNNKEDALEFAKSLPEFKLSMAKL